MLHAQDLLDQRIIESGYFVPTLYLDSVSDAIREIVDMARLTLTSRVLTIEYITNKRHNMMFDKRRLQQVLLNLISNAIKFQNKGAIQVFATFQPKEDDSFIEITVKDQGIGMTAEETKHVFQPFSQLANSQGSNKMSNGMGLSICKKICEQLGGDIKVSSIPQKGSTFTFSMKVYHPELPKLKKIENSIKSESKKGKKK